MYLLLLVFTARCEESNQQEVVVMHHVGNWLEGDPFESLLMTDDREPSYVPLRSKKAKDICIKQSMTVEAKCESTLSSTSYVKFLIV